MPLIYDMEQQYPMEMKLSRYIVAQMEKVFHVKLKRNELSGIAMSIISAKITSEQKTNGTDKIDFEGVLKDIGRIIEKELHIVVNKESFDYARFATHIKYLLDRICSKQYIDTDNNGQITADDRQFCGSPWAKMQMSLVLNAEW
jgi:beta-glucoside operon transcriptional antiterminator